LPFPVDTLVHTDQTKHYFRIQSLHHHQLAGRRHSPQSFPDRTRSRFRHPQKIGDRQGVAIICGNATAGSVRSIAIQMSACNKCSAIRASQSDVSAAQSSVRNSISIKNRRCHSYGEQWGSAQDQIEVHHSIPPRRASPMPSPRRKNYLARILRGPRQTVASHHRSQLWWPPA
jgi:hypothetical protein